MAKFRIGFVSNSSSSSFVLFGCEIPSEIINEMVKKEIIDEIKEQYGENIPTETDEDYGSLYDFLEMNQNEDYISEMCQYEKYELIENQGIQHFGEEFYIGFNPDEFKTRPNINYNELVQEYTQKCLGVGMKKEDINFEYIEGVDNNC